MTDGPEVADAATSAPASPAPPAPSVAQRLVIVLPTTGEFDSRTYRIATSAAARGHVVTVVGRSAPNLPQVETGPGGYRIVRVAVEAVDGLPFAGVWRRLRLLRRRGSAQGSRRAGEPARDAGSAGSGVAHGGRGPMARIRAVVRGAYRVAAIGLTVRAQTRAARAVDPGADLYHGMAYMGIPVAAALGARSAAPVVYDARDIYLEARNLARLPQPARWLVGRAERHWAHRARRVVTVNDAYADVLERNLGVHRPLVVMNCSLRYTPPEPRERRFHNRLGLPPERAVVLYHGGLFPERGIEELIAAIEDVPAADLVLMGYGALEAGLPAMIATSPAGRRIHVLPAVPPGELHDWVAAADVVAMPIQASTLNHRLTTPNKLFEAMAAGVPVVASDLPGMASIVTETGCGVLCDPADPMSIAAAIRSILDASPDDRAGYGLRGRRAAAEIYNWEAQAAVLFAEYGRLTGRPW